MTKLAFFALLLLLWLEPSFQQVENYAAESLSSLRLGAFIFYWDPANPFVQINHHLEPNRPLFRTLHSWPFITVGYATDSKPPIVDGNYKVNEWTLFETPYQNIKKVTYEEDGVIRMVGEAWGLVTIAEYEMTFKLSPDGTQILFEITATAVQGTFNRLFLNYWCASDENMYGFGVQYTYWNLKGRRVPILVAEQGIGRGAQPVTAFLNFFADGTGGDPMTTYAPKPLYLTNYNRSMVFENTEIMFFDMRDDDAVVAELWGTKMKGRIMYGKSFLDIVTQITEVTGRMQPLPGWTQRGAVVGLEGGTRSVVSKVNRLLGHGVPLAGLWLQDWVGLRNAYDGDRLLWNWQLDNR
jgi:alpha-glucosidase